MTPSQRTQRLTARTIVATFVILGLVILFVPSASLGSIFDLQQTGSPTGSPTRTGSPTGSPTGGSPAPSPTGIKEIQWLNPSANSTVISAKNDGTNTTYHLTAVARVVPVDPLVEFKIQQGTANEQSIGIASRVGTSDAFDMQWSPAAFTDGSYVLKAILYSANVEISRDEITVTVNNADSPTDPQAEAIEITYPVNGQDTGFFQPQGATAASTVVDVTSSGQTTPPSTSTGTMNITVSYTKTPPGQEPVWTSCGTATRASTGINSVRCTLASGDTPAVVVGLAARAAPAGAPIAPTTVSGDAHRVFPYDQVPTSVTLNPAAQSGKAAGACADAIVATVLDQDNRKVAGVNTDVHAKGPTDLVRFDDSGDNSSAHQPPDKAHAAPEQAWNCEGTGGAGNQGKHDLSPGNPDIKHVETVGTGGATTGTDNAGQFKFQLYSPDGPGDTAVVVFADTDDDDLWCAEEASGNGTVGWSANPSPSPTSTSTASPSPSPTRTSSPSGSPTRTGSPGGSPTGPQPTPEPTTLRPERESCPRGGASPTQTSPGPGTRSMNLETSRGRARAGARVELSGVVQSQDTSCEDNELVEIARRIHGTNRFKAFRTTSTDAEGNYSTRFRVKKSADYQATVEASGSCSEASSEAEDVLVRVKVTIAASDRRVPAGGEVVFTGKVSPNHRGDRVVLQRKKGKRWVKVATSELNRRSRYAFEIEVDWSGKRVFRARWPKQAPSNLAGSSGGRTVKAT